MSADARQTLELTFRRFSARLVAQLCRRLGPARLDLAEDAVQFSLLQAARTWPVRGVPSAPEAWLARVANNRLTDLVRGSGQQPTEALEPVSVPEVGPTATLKSEFEDDELRLLFATCHPALSPEMQLTLSLKVACGLGTREIARALLVDEPAVAQRLVRARKTLQALGGPLEVPAGHELPPRRAAVLQALYLMFNEGYERTEGHALIDATLCTEALRLVEGVLAHEVTTSTEGHALAALMCFRAAALPTRVDGGGSFIPAHRRAAPEEGLVHRGVRHLGASMGDALSAFHLEAELAFLQVTHSPAAWPWPRLLELYDSLLKVRPGPVVALNRVVVLAEVHGVPRALTALAQLDGLDQLERYPWRHAVEAHLQRKAGAWSAAREAFTRAAECAVTEPQREFLRAEARACAD